MLPFTHEYINPAFTSFVEQINTMKGNTVKEKVEGYLLSIGVTSEEIANIREIFLEASEK